MYTGELSLPLSSSSSASSSSSPSSLLAVLNMKENILTTVRSLEDDDSKMFHSNSKDILALLLMCDRFGVEDCLAVCGDRLASFVCFDLTLRDLVIEWIFPLHRYNHLVSACPHLVTAVRHYLLQQWKVWFSFSL